MPFSRYDKRELFFNDDREYKKVFFKDRDLAQTYQFKTAIIGYPTDEQFQELESIPLRWGSTDKLYNIADEYYGSPEYWWVISWFNQKPTEAHFKVGDIYYVPQPLSDVLAIF